MDLHRDPLYTHTHKHIHTYTHGTNTYIHIRDRRTQDAGLIPVRRALHDAFNRSTMITHLRWINRVYEWLTLLKVHMAHWETPNKSILYAASVTHGMQRQTLLRGICSLMWETAFANCAVILSAYFDFHVGDHFKIRSFQFQPDHNFNTTNRTS